MDWGLLQGLGQGMQQLGNMKMEQDAEKRRAQLAEKLQADREERAEQRMRTRPDPSQTTYEEGEGGVTWKVIRSGTGAELERVLAPKTDIDKIKRDTDKEKLSIDALTAQIESHRINTDAKKKEVAWEEEDRALMSPAERAAAMKVKGGLLPSADTRYSTDGSLQRAVLTESGKASRDDDEAESATIADYADDYLEQNPGVAAKYIDTKVLTENQAKDAVIQVLREFSRRGVKPTQSDFRSALDAYAKNLPKKKEETTGIKMRLQDNNG